MASPRETPNTDLLEPIGPNFTRRTVAAGAAQEKYPTVEDKWNDINRQPTRAAGAGITVIMDVPVTLRRARVLLQNTVVSLPAADDYGSVQLVALPDRNIVIYNAEFVGTVVFGGEFANDDDPTIGVGQAPATNTTLATTMQDIIPVTTFTNIVAGAANAIAVSKAAPGTGVLVADSATSALYLNVSGAGDVLSESAGTATFNGYFDFWYLDLGNESS